MGPPGKDFISFQKKIIELEEIFWNNRWTIIKTKHTETGRIEKHLIFLTSAKIEKKP